MEQKYEVSTIKGFNLIVNSLLDECSIYKADREAKCVSNA